MVKPLMDAYPDGPFQFCDWTTDWRIVAEHVAAEGTYRFDWCLGAMEAANGDITAARAWLSAWAPKSGA